MNILKRDFYNRNTLVVAIELLGKVLVVQHAKKRLRAKIVETEAYFGATDPASHAYRGMTPRNCLMFGLPGFTYVYFIYGNHYCFNVSALKSDAILIRALEPLEGIELMKKRRCIKDIKNLTNGPGKLTKAFGIDKRHDGLDLTKSNLFIEDSNEKIKIVKTIRIGISKAKEKLLRFYIKDNGFVSRK